MQVKDIVKGLPGAPFGIINEKMTKALVLDVVGDEITIKILKHEYGTTGVFTVKSQYLEVIGTQKPFNREEVIALLEKGDINRVLDYDLAGANLAGADLRRANLAGADLRRANLAEADLTEADLREANLAEADLTEANLTGANLAVANLAVANLKRADLTGANLAVANLTGANLAVANLTGANLTEANLTGAINMVKLMGVCLCNRYYKAIGDELENMGYTYTVGLNVLRDGEVFADDDRRICSYPGFHFASESWCKANYGGRRYMCLIRIPLKEEYPEVAVNEPWATDGKASANAIIIEKVFDTQDDNKDVTEQFVGWADGKGNKV